MPRRRFVHILKVGLVGQPEPLCLRISKREAKRFDMAMRTPSPQRPFFVWDSSVATVVISLCDVQFANVLWDRPANVDPDPKVPDRDTIELRFRDRPPMEAGAGSPQEIWSLVARLAVGNMMGELAENLDFLDDDGEQFWIRADQLVYMSVPKWLMDEGLKENEALWERESDEAERKAAAERLIAEVSSEAPGTTRTRRRRVK